MNDKEWDIYLSGEVHSDWREKIEKAAYKENLPVQFFSPITDHEASDNCGDIILGVEKDKFWKDHKAAKINAIRTRTLIDEADIVIVRFGDKYKQWNAAFDAGFAAASGTPLIVMHHPDDTHALKEVDATALAVAETVEQVIEILKHVTMQK
ncbi:MAG: YtoQ family protein [candidate division Zixibacteria bacterium]|nr:YtoQ family protein [candidate division Zixibacteria bacterium]